jgi:hypothetical protein
MRKRIRCIINFNRQHKLFIDKITKLGFVRFGKNRYSCYNYNILVTRFYEYYHILLYYHNKGGQKIYETTLLIKDFHKPNIIKHDVILNKILNIGIFSRKLKIQKILKNDIFQK